jgi:hypothetical protein
MRIRVTDKYGQRWPCWTKYVGEEGTLDSEARDDGYVAATLDVDGKLGLFLPDEVERII